MKTLELDELRKMDAKKLIEELASANKEIAKARFEVRSGQSKNSHLISNYKTYIAQIKTILTEQELNPKS